jgi:hypothetical protein
MNNARWPLRYRLGHRLHCKVNWVHYKTGKHQLTQWLNDQAAELWVPWWMEKGRFTR